MSCDVHSERADLTEETLEKQYEVVARRTSNNYTYNMGSHVMQFGALDIDEEPAADYLGDLNTGAFASYSCKVRSLQRCISAVNNLFLSC